MTTIVTSFLSQLDSIGLTFVRNVYQSLAGELAGLFRIMLVLYIVLWGYDVLFRRAHGSPVEAAEKLLRAFVIYTLATQWGTFSILVYNVVTQLPDTVGNTVISAIARNGGSGAPTSAVGTALNMVYDTGVKLQGSVYTGSYLDIFGAFLAAIVLIAMIIFVGLAVAIIVANKLMIIISVCIGPIVIIAALFRVSSGYLDGYIKLLVGLMLGTVFLYFFIAFYASIIDSVSKYAITTGDGAAARIGQIVPFILVCIVGFYCISQIQGLAQTIAGGMVTGSSPGMSMAMGAAGLVKGTIGSAMGGDRKNKQPPPPTNDKQSPQNSRAAALQNALKKSGTASS